MLFSFQAWLRVNSRAAKAKKLGVETRILQPLGCAPPDALLLAPSECPGPPPPADTAMGRGAAVPVCSGRGRWPRQLRLGAPRTSPAPGGSMAALRGLSRAAPHSRSSCAQRPTTSCMRPRTSLCHFQPGLDPEQLPQTQGHKAHPTPALTPFCYPQGPPRPPPCPALHPQTTAPSHTWTQAPHYPILP